MKNRLFIFFFCFTIWSCSNRIDVNSNSVDKSTIKDNLISQTDTSRIEINANFPFGCADLTKFKYPKNWEGDLENYGHLKKNDSQEFENIKKCFDGINLAKTVKTPIPQSIELLEIGNSFKNANNLDRLMQKSIDSCRYRLPNMGIYECYYSYTHYGNLMLLNPKTNKGKLLNIYANDLGGDSHTLLRYFFIDESGITIYEANYYDDGCSLNETFKIVVNTNGEIKINKIKK